MINIDNIVDENNLKTFLILFNNVGNVNRVCSLYDIQCIIFKFQAKKSIEGKSL